MPTYVRTQEIAHPIGARGRFALRVTSPEVELRAGHGTQATARIQFELRADSEEEADELFERLRYRVRQGDGLLEVSEPRRSGAGIGSIVRLLVTGSARVGVSITATLPDHTEVAFEGVSADVTASGFHGAQEYRTVSGDLVLDRIGGDLKIRGVSGDVSIRADRPIELEMNSVSGDVSAVAPRFDAMRLVTVSGDVELEGEFAARGAAPHRDRERGPLARRRRRTDARGSRAVKRHARLGASSIRGLPRPAPLHHRWRRGEPPVQLDVGRRLGPPRPTWLGPDPPDAARASDPTDAAERSRSLRASSSRSCGRWNPGRSTWTRPPPGWPEERPMPDELETILRLVADGALSAEEAAPIIDALTRAERAEHQGTRAHEDEMSRSERRLERQLHREKRRIERAVARAQSRINEVSGRQLRIQVKEGGRQRVNLRIPIGFVDAAIGFVPGLGGDQAERIRDAVKSGELGPIIDVEDPDGDSVQISVE